MLSSVTAVNAGPGRGESSTLQTPFFNFSVHSYTCIPVTVLNSHPMMNLYRFHAFAKQKSHNTSLLLLCVFSNCFPGFLCVPTPSIGSSRSPPSRRMPYTQWYRSYTRFLIQLLRFRTKRPLYIPLQQFRRHSVHCNVQSTLIGPDDRAGSRYKLPGLAGPEGGPGPDYAAIRS